MTRNRKVKNDVLQITEGVLETAVDFTLFLAFWGLEFLFMTGKRGYSIADQSYVDEALELINYQTIKNAIKSARKEGWISPAAGRKRVDPKITEAGKRRLEAKLPFYDDRRVWDGVLHLVTYDIPEEKKNDREILREKLAKIGCGMLQKSVWLTPYNPRDTLEEFIRERRLKASVIISSIAKGGSIGEETIDELVCKVYNLDELNERYFKFVDKYRNGDKSPLKVIFAYLSILQNDPQLPFALLPDDWIGDEANEIYRSFVEILRKQRQEERKGV